MSGCISKQEIKGEISQIKTLVTFHKIHSSLNEMLTTQNSVHVSLGFNLGTQIIVATIWVTK